ncbi:MAG: single-stranded DNA-binding protein, partial [Desulfobacteraceae bacterium]
RFFARFFVANYCPLLFIEAGGRNRTPDRLPPTERGPLLAACDRALRRSVELLTPRHVVGVGKFAETRALQALAGLPVVVGRLTHPSPANPAANRGWGALAARELADLGISLETPGDP